MICIKCGRQIDDGSVFCRFCGASLEAPQPQAQTDQTVYLQTQDDQTVYLQTQDQYGYAQQQAQAAQAVYPQTQDDQTVYLQTQDQYGYAQQQTQAAQAVYPQTPDQYGYAQQQAQAAPTGYAQMQDQPQYGYQQAQDQYGYQQAQMPPGMAAAPVAAAASQPKPKKKKKTGLILGIVFLVLALAAGGGYYAYKKISAPRPLTINSNEDIEFYLDNVAEIPVVADGLTPTDIQNIVWTTDSDLISITDGTLSAVYDRTLFDGTSNSYTTTIHGTLKKGIKNWEGSANVIVRLQPVDFKSGEMFKKPAGSTGSYININASDSYNTYFYFESASNPENDFSFIVEQGKTQKINVPCDTYTVYEASGQTWFGQDIMFGPSTTYDKLKDPLEFTSSTYWTLTLGVTDGNAPSDTISPDDFPE